MSDTVKVIIQAEATVKFKKTVEMKKADYDKYLQICAECSFAREIEERIREIAFEYDFDDGSGDIDDIGMPDYIEFTLVE
ncbi:hypothetical protein DLB95_08750 [Salmonella enterica subsp. diarizonae]|uniref:Uncharacterized protein n=1 Tax=Salmonella diarizonae TaxID=59204 RepID=A0A5Y3W090_SALDZ|nr:hypothetical protein [Salmonella enterica subsp. diarizonae]ECJ4377372.1 hypothetical protein [Salmonella enterica subsp. diarizonae]